MLHVERGRVVERARDLVHEPEVLIDMQALLAVQNRGLEVAGIVMGLRNTRVQVRQRRAVPELLRQRDRTLVGEERLLRLTLVRLGDREIDEPAELERRVVDDAVVGGLHAFFQHADRFLVRVRAGVGRREDRLDADLLLL